MTSDIRHLSLMTEQFSKQLLHAIDLLFPYC